MTEPQSVDFKSEQGFIVYYNKIVAGNPAPSTFFPHARIATYDDVSFEGHWLIKDEAGDLLAIVPDRDLMAIMKLQTEGPASDANKPN